MKQHEQDQGKHPEKTEQSVAALKEQLVAVSNEKEQQLIEAQTQAKEYLELLQRAQADFINYRRRMSQEQAEIRKSAQIELLKQFLPIFDDLERAMAVTPPNLATNPWGQGLLLIARRLTALLDQLGIKQIGAPGDTFDPRLHEAITIESSADAPEGTIVRVVRTGYVLGDRVICPAQVVVAGAPSLVDTAPS